VPDGDNYHYCLNNEVRDSLGRIYIAPPPVTAAPRVFPQPQATPKDGVLTAIAIFFLAPIFIVLIALVAVGTFVFWFPAIIVGAIAWIWIKRNKGGK
jgi:hypothetical protein